MPDLLCVGNSSRGIYARNSSSERPQGIATASAQPSGMLSGLSTFTG
jgi:hypothetical protein